ncbi:DUF11 domain-containing protein [Rhodopirellula sp. JC740]|uniref:DUF11 domain-containing protein n=1 Tax=Rhodopirellula halodulae TaxID=2894198 RepID=A0ABS8NJ18_9BACT|nr:DUF11 domain-containing protein [Rhodopirellula sp. JC740]MCC9643547.1 DUF11 domain-containing protein [Rhodopirellula sp. JC740]
MKIRSFRRRQKLRTRSSAARGWRRLLLESLESRRLLAVASDLVTIRGQVTDSFLGGDFEDVALDLYRDDGDGVFEPNSGDVEVNMAVTDASGNYQFTGVTEGSYFVLQPAQTNAGRSLQQQLSPLITVTASQVAGQTFQTIDSFQTTQSVQDTTTDSTPVISTQAAAEAIGGSRDLIVNKTQGGNNDIGTIAIGVNQAVSPNLLSFDASGFADGSRRVIWDGGGDDAGTINDDGLGAIDLTSGGSASGLRFVIGSVTSGTAVIRLYSDDGDVGTQSRVSQATLTIPALPTQPTSIEYIPFTDFQVVSGGGADLTQIGAIELDVSGGPDYDAIADLLGTVGPNIIVQNFDNAGDADLELTKTLVTTNPNVNQNVSFDVVVTNNGPDPATGIEVTDRIPDGITGVTGTTSNGTFTPGTGIWTIPNLAVGASATLRVTGQLTSLDPQTNVAEITASEQRDDDSPRNNNVLADDDQDSAVVTATRVDLQLDKAVSNVAPNVGDEVTFTLTLQNTSLDASTDATLSTATGILVEDRLPTGMTLLSHNASSGTTFNTATRRWSIASLEVGSQATLQILARVDQAGEFTNVAEVLAVSQFDRDSTPMNDLIDEDDQDQVTIVTPTADLSLTKTSSTDTPTVGETITFTIRVDNDGPDDATGVQVRDVLPAGFTYVTNSATSGNYDQTTGVWTVGDVDAPSAVNPIPVMPTLQIVATVDSLGAKTNTATIIASDQADPDSTPDGGLADEDDTASVVITPNAIDLQLTKAVSISNPAPGDSIVYTVTLSNADSTASVPITTATNVQVTDVLPEGLILQDFETSSGTYVSSTGVWSIDSLAEGASETLTLTAVLDPSRTDLLTTITNTSEVTQAAQFDPDSSPDNQDASEDDQASIAILPARADLSLTKTADRLNADVGENVTFTITARHDGSDESGQFVVSDVLPAGLQFVEATESIGTYDETTGRWTIPGLDSSTGTATPSLATLEIVATTLIRGTITNAAEIIQATLPDPDSTPGNGELAEDDQAEVSLQAEQIDLALFKTVDNATPRLGETLQYELVIRNDGLDDATGVIVQENLPAGLTFVNATASDGSFSGSSGLWTIGNLAASESATLTINVQVNNNVTADLPNIINRAEVIAADQVDLDSTPDNNEASEDDQASVTARVEFVDLSLSKSVDNPAPNVGDQVAFTVTVTNDGDTATSRDTATNVVVQDLLPTGFTLVSSLLTDGLYDSTSGEWTIDALADDASATLTLIATVDQRGTLVNRAEVVSVDQDDVDSTPNNNAAAEDDLATASITTPVIDLSLTQTVAPERPAIGGEVTFTLSLQNSGPDDATGVVVRDTLPGGFTFTSSSPAGDFNSSTGLWTVGDLAAGQTATLDIIGTIGDVEELINRAEVIAADQADSDSTPDSGLGDGEDDTASAIATLANADLSVTKTVDDATPNFGDSVTFTVTIANSGPDPATGIQLRDYLPAGFTLADQSVSVGTFSATTEIWMIDELAVGQSETLTLTGTVNSEATLSNVAEIIASDQRDPDSTPGNGETNPVEDDRAAVDVQAQLIDLALSKTVDGDRFDLGDLVEFELTVSNTGPSTATNVQVADALPAGLIFDSSSTANGGYNPQSGTWTIPSIPSNESLTLTLNATVNRDAITDEILRDGILNFAEVTSADQPDRNSTFGNGDVNEDDADSALLMIARADLSLTKSVDTSNPDRGDTIQYLITLTNANNDAATNVVVRDLLPGSVQFVDAIASQGNFDPQTGLWTVSQLDSSQSATLRINATVQASGTVDNVAEIIASDQIDPDSTPNNANADEDDLASVSITPRVVDISVVASVDNEEPELDETITITLTAANASGVSDATGVVIESSLPDGLTLIPPASPQQGTYDPATGLWNVGSLGAGESVQLTLTARVDTRGLKTLNAEVVQTDQFDLDSVPDNGDLTEDDQTQLEIRAPRVLSKRLFLSR